MRGKDGTFASQLDALEKRWATEERWSGIHRNYSAEEVVSLRGSLHVEHSIARAGAERLRELLNSEVLVRTFGALTGAQAGQMVRGGLNAIYVSGWQVAGDQNLSGETYPDMSLEGVIEIDLGRLHETIQPAGLAS